MAYADDLLGIAQHLANLDPHHAHQASLRRAISTACYALFHLLISEATANWSRPELRGALARVFDHGAMKQAAESKVSELNSYLNGNPPAGYERTVADHLHNVVNVFVQMQYHRNEADYNVDKQWKFTEVQLHVASVVDAFSSWRVIREEPVAQAYLVSMLASKERRQSKRPGIERRLPLKNI
jgi:hypothetical protein